MIRALEKEGLKITADPLALYFCDTRLKADVGADKHIAADNKGQKIAVEIKDFDSDSLTNDLQKDDGTDSARRTGTGPRTLSSRQFKGVG